MFFLKAYLLMCCEILLGNISVFLPVLLCRTHTSILWSLFWLLSLLPISCESSQKCSGGSSSGFVFAEEFACWVDGMKLVFKVTFALGVFIFS